MTRPQPEPVDDAGSSADAAVEPSPQADSGPTPLGSLPEIPVLDECGEGTVTWASQKLTRAEPDWSEGARIPITGRPNLYGFEEAELLERVRAGKLHTLTYPVTISRAWVPYRLLKNALENKTPGLDLLLDPIQSLISPLPNFESVDDFEKFLGLIPFPDCDGKGMRSVPFFDDTRPDYRMGSTRLEMPDGTGYSVSCAGCHASRLFGRTILGLQNRASNANASVALGRDVMGILGSTLVGTVLGATPGEQKMLDRLTEASQYIGSRSPLVRGLDTSLAQVALSLARRNQDDYATPNPKLIKTPRPDPIADVPSDSKPGNWWVLKYKNRFLLDGSVVSGNPVFTNFIWNEIGRGTDLKELEQWLADNQPIVDELTAAVFSAEPVRMTEFFPAEIIDLASAKRGKVLFDANCASCHGTYVKAWEFPEAAALPLADRLATVEVRYHELTPVDDVGTDDHRYKGMKSLEQLNDARHLQGQHHRRARAARLRAAAPRRHLGALSVLPQQLGAEPVRRAHAQRRSPRRATTAASRSSPTPTSTSSATATRRATRRLRSWKEDEAALYDTSVPGLGNQGHDEGVFLKDGAEMYTPAQKRDIVRFLQTL